MAEERKRKAGDLGISMGETTHDGPRREASSSSINPQQTSNLLNRLQNFLPQIQRANQELESASALDAGARQIDDTLGKEEDAHDDDSEECSDAENDEDDSTLNNNPVNDTEKEQQTIQIQFEVADVDKNPIINMLADANDDNLSQGDSCNKAEASDEEDEKNAAISNLLSNRSDNSKSTNKPSKPLISVLEETSES